MIRRPLMYLTTALAAGIITSYYFGTNIAFIAVTCFAMLLMGKKKFTLLGKKMAVIIALGFFSGVMAFSISQHDDSFLLSVTGETGEMEVLVLQVEEKQGTTYGGYIQMKTRVNKWEDMTLDGTERILLRYYRADADSAENGRYGDTSFVDIIPGDMIRVTGQVMMPEGRRNPGCFDYALYLRSMNIRVCMTVDSISATDHRGGNSLRGRLYNMRERFLREMEETAGTETAGLMRGILFGGKSHMEEDTLETFQKNGTAHVLAVSGLHVGIIYGFLSAFWRWRKGRLFFCLTMAFFGCYIILADFSPSVVRAVFMVGLHAFAGMTNRRYDLSSAAFLTALLMLLKNPMQIFHAGFQMSFLAVLTLSLILPIAGRFINGMLLGSVSIQIGLLPYTIYTFNYLSVAAVLVNVPVILLTGVIVPLGLCSVAAMYVWDPLFQLMSGMLSGLCRMLTQINGMTGIDGVTVFTATSPPLVLVICYYLGLLFFVAEDGRLAVMRKGKAFVMKAVALTAVLSLLLGTVAGNGFRNADLVFVDVGQGDCMHIRTDEGRNYLIDGGGSIDYNVGKKTLKPYLLKNGARRVDGAFVTHLHTDHYKGIAELCHEGMVDRLFLYEGNRTREKQILEETGLSSEDITYLYKGQIVNLGRDVRVRVMWPQRGTECTYMNMESAGEEVDENASSMILMTEMKGFRMIATADVDSVCLDGLAEEWGRQLDADIIKVPHHGSKYSFSDAFTQSVSPRYAVFQVGRNKFGHPDEGVVENYLEKDIIGYRNDENGAIAFIFTEDCGIRTRTVKGEHP